MLVIARDTTHAAALLSLIKSDAFFEGRYKDKVIQVDSSRSGAEEEMITRLLKVEHTEKPTESLGNTRWFRMMRSLKICRRMDLQLDMAVNSLI